MSLLTSCASLSRKLERVNVPQEILAEMEIGRFKQIYSNLPDFVAYGEYSFSFMLNRQSGKFRMYKLADTMYIKLDNGKAFVLPIDSIMSIKNGKLNLKLSADTSFLSWDRGSIVLVGDNLERYKDAKIEMIFENYEYDPIPLPRRLIIRSMGFSGVFLIDSVVPLQ